MSDTYFHRVQRETDTRFWVNNPSMADMEKSVAAGAINCTTNPAYCQKLLSIDADYITSVIDEVILEGAGIEDAAPEVYRRATGRVCDFFMPLYEESEGTCGYVTLQDDPRLDEDAEAVTSLTLENKKIGANYMAKIPVIPGGIAAIERCVQEDIPICATEVFSIAQAVHMCDAYQEASAATGKAPPFYITHISGIFDEYLKKTVEREGIEISGEVLGQAGCTVARKQYHLLKERGYNAIILGGGARELKHFTELVGGDAHITINWSTARELIDADPAVENRIDAETSKDVIDELLEKLPDFRKAYLADGLTVEEFSDYGPVQLFRNAFLNGWYTLLAAIAKRRNALAI